MALQVIRSARANYSLEDFIGDKGQIFYREDLGDLRLSDGQTPGGIELLSAGFSASFVNDLLELVTGDIEATDFLVGYDSSTNSVKKIRVDSLPTGFTGSQGEIGYTGSIGEQGPIGFTGSAGINGYTGSKGLQGLRGYTGSQGEIGYAGSSGFSNLVFSENGDTRILTNYKNDQGETFTVRSTTISNGVFSLSLASFTPTLNTTVLPATSLNWDVPVQGFRINVNNPDDFTSRYISSVRSIQPTSGSITNILDNFTTSGPNITPSGGVDWQQDFFTNGSANIYSASTSITGGSASATITFNEYSQEETEYTDSNATFSIAWATPTLGVTISNLSGNNFLQSYSSTTYMISVTGISNSNNYSLSVAGTGGNVSNLTGNGTFTFDTPVHKNNLADTRSVSVSSIFTRPSGVTGSSYTATLTAEDTSFITTFTYPSFWLFTSSVFQPPGSTDIVNVNNFKTGVTALGNQAKAFSGFVTNNEITPKVFWLGVRSSASQPSVFKTGASVSLLSDVEPTTAAVSLSPDPVPAGYIAENFSLYGIILQPGSTYVNIS